MLILIAFNIQTRNHFYESDNKSTDINTILHIKFQQCVIGFINRYCLDKMKLYTCNRTSCAYSIELLNWPLLVSLFFLQNIAVCKTHAKYTRETAVSNRIKSSINMTITGLAYSYQGILNSSPRKTFYEHEIQ